jgi:diguanylate cyclase (GGDEF)-like protein
MVLLQHIKQGLRLNRGLALSLLAVSIPLSYLGQFSHKTPGPWPWLSAAAFVLLSLLFWTVSEMGLRLLKKPPRPEDSVLEKLSYLLPFVTAAYLILSYCLTAHLAVLLCLPFAPLQAQIFGHRGLGRLLLISSALIYLLGCPLGYPRPLEEFYGAGALTINGLQLFLSLVPMAWAFHQAGDFISNWVRSTSTRVNKLQSLATTDAMTGLINRRQFNVRLEAESARVRRYQHSLSLALFDIDDFKKINDLYGHPTGDRILSELGKLISQNVRESDIPARYGGEEFALILPETAKNQAAELLERLRLLVEETVFCLPDNPMTITISVGVQQMENLQSPVYELIAQADAALYEAKRTGKNRVVCAATSVLHNISSP